MATTAPPPPMGADHTRLMRHLHKLYEAQARMSLALEAASEKGRKRGDGDEVDALLAYHQKTVALVEPYLDGIYFVEEREQLIKQEQHAGTATAASPLARVSKKRAAPAESKAPVKKGHHSSAPRASKTSGVSTPIEHGLLVAGDAIADASGGGDRIWTMNMMSRVGAMEATLRDTVEDALTFLAPPTSVCREGNVATDCFMLAMELFFTTDHIRRRELVASVRVEFAHTFQPPVVLRQTPSHPPNCCHLCSSTRSKPSVTWAGKLLMLSAQILAYAVTTHEPDERGCFMDTIQAVCARDDQFPYLLRRSRKIASTIPRVGRDLARLKLKHEAQSITIICAEEEVSSE